MRQTFLFMFFLVSSTCLQAEKIDGYDFPEKLKVEKQELVLNGAGTRERLFVKIYDSALYLLEKSKDGTLVMNDDKSMAVRMHFVYSKVTKEKLKSTWNDCFVNVTDGKVEPIKDEVEKFCSLFGAEDVKKGDVFDLVYTSEKGVTVIKNQKLLGNVKGLPFKKALFSVWFGDKPIQKNLKLAMLGM